jgi:polyphosphate glucokinase
VQQANRGKIVKILVIDIGGNSVKLLMSEATEPRKFPSGPRLTPRQMVDGVQKLTEDWKFDAMTIGYPGMVKHNRPSEEPNNLGRGWLNFDFGKAFGVPVKVINDAAMQALGSYRGGTMLFLGLGTGLGTAMVVDGTVVPMELGRLSYKQGSYEDLLGLKGLGRLGIKKWREAVEEVVARFMLALELDDLVIGGGNVNKLDKMPPGCRAGGNALAFRGGFLLWEESGNSKKRTRVKRQSRRTKEAPAAD